MSIISTIKLPLVTLTLLATQAMAQTQTCSLPESDTPASCKPKVCMITNLHGEKHYLVNRDVYRGWKLFRSYCHACHLEEPQVDFKLDENRASPFYLVSQVKVKALTYKRFEKVVRNGRFSEIGWMPAWKRNQLVAPSTPQIFAYLEVRASCDLPYIVNRRLAVFDQGLVESR